MTASPRFEPTPNSRDGYDDRGSLTLSPEGIITDASYAASKTLELPFDDLISKPAIPLIKSRFPEWPGPDKGVDGSPRQNQGVTVSELPLGDKTDSNDHWQIELIAEKTGTRLQFYAKADKAKSQRPQYPASKGPHLAETNGSFVAFTQAPDLRFIDLQSDCLGLIGVEKEAILESPKSFEEAIHPLDIAEYKAAIHAAQGSAETVQIRFRINHLKTHQILYLAEHRKAILGQNGEVITYEGFWVNESEKTLAQRRLQTASWKETLALVTMGLAHDFTNRLSGILGITGTLREEIASPKGQQGLSSINDSASEAVEQVKRIVNLHQGKAGEMSFYDLSQLVSDQCDLIDRILSRSVTLSKELAKGEMAVKLDAFEFGQMMLNLALNAQDAMPSGGTLTIGTASEIEPQEAIYIRGNYPSRKCYCVTIADNGHGIEEDKIQSIFDPFFTTKFRNKGSGLGLYNCQHILERHQGAIGVQSKKGRGTTFYLWFPEADFSEADGSNINPLTRPNLLVYGLDANDVSSLANSLRSFNFQTATACSEEELDQRFRTSLYPINCLLVLLNRPDSISPEAILKHTSENTKMRFALMTIGCNPDAIPSDLSESADLQFHGNTSEADIAKMISRCID